MDPLELALDDFGGKVFVLEPVVIEAMSVERRDVFLKNKLSLT